MNAAIGIGVVSVLLALVIILALIPTEADAQECPKCPSCNMRSSIDFKHQSPLAPMSYDYTLLEGPSTYNYPDFNARNETANFTARVNPDGTYQPGDAFHPINRINIKHCIAPSIVDIWGPESLDMTSFSTSRGTVAPYRQHSYDVAMDYVVTVFGGSVDREKQPSKKGETSVTYEYKLGSVDFDNVKFRFLLSEYEYRPFSKPNYAIPGVYSTEKLVSKLGNTYKMTDVHEALTGEVRKKMKTSGKQYYEYEGRQKPYILEPRLFYTWQEQSATNNHKRSISDFVNGHGGSWLDKKDGKWEMPPRTLPAYEPSTLPTDDPDYKYVQPEPLYETIKSMQEHVAYFNDPKDGPCKPGLDGAPYMCMTSHVEIEPELPYTCMRDKLVTSHFGISVIPPITPGVIPADNRKLYFVLVSAIKPPFSDVMSPLDNNDKRADTPYSGEDSPYVLGLVHWDIEKLEPLKLGKFHQEPQKHLGQEEAQACFAHGTATHYENSRTDASSIKYECNLIAGRPAEKLKDQKLGESYRYAYDSRVDIFSDDFGISGKYIKFPSTNKDFKQDYNYTYNTINMFPGENEIIPDSIEKALGGKHPMINRIKHLAPYAYNDPNLPHRGNTPYHMNHPTSPKISGDICLYETTKEKLNPEITVLLKARTLVKEDCGCKTRDVHKEVKINVDITRPEFDIWYDRSVPLHDRYGFPAGNIDETWYVHDPVHIIHDPSTPYREQRNGTLWYNMDEKTYDDKFINSTTNNTHTSQSRIHDFESRQNTKYIHTVDITANYSQYPLSHDFDDFQTENGGGHTVYNFTYPAYGWHDYYYKMTLHNLNRPVSTTYNVSSEYLSPYEPVYDYTHVYPHLADGQSSMVEDRQGTILRYHGNIDNKYTNHDYDKNNSVKFGKDNGIKIGNNTVFPERRSLINMWSVDHILDRHKAENFGFISTYVYNDTHKNMTAPDAYLLSEITSSFNTHDKLPPEYYKKAGHIYKDGTSILPSVPVSHMEPAQADNYFNRTYPAHNATMFIWSGIGKILWDNSAIYDSLYPQPHINDTIAQSAVSAEEKNTISEHKPSLWTGYSTNTTLYTAGFAGLPANEPLVLDNYNFTYDLEADYHQEIYVETVDFMGRVTPNDLWVRHIPIFMLNETYDGFGNRFGQLYNYSDQNSTNIFPSVSPSAYHTTASYLDKYIENRTTADLEWHITHDRIIDAYVELVMQKYPDLIYNQTATDTDGTVDLQIHRSNVKWSDKQNLTRSTNAEDARMAALPENLKQPYSSWHQGVDIHAKNGGFLAGDFTDELMRNLVPQAKAGNMGYIESLNKSSNEFAQFGRVKIGDGNETTIDTAYLINKTDPESGEISLEVDYERYIKDYTKQYYDYNSTLYAITNGSDAAIAAAIPDEKQYAIFNPDTSWSFANEPLLSSHLKMTDIVLEIFAAPDTIDREIKDNESMDVIGKKTERLKIMPDAQYTVREIPPLTPVPAKYTHVLPPYLLDMVTFGTKHQITVNIETDNPLRLLPTDWDNEWVIVFSSNVGIIPIITMQVVNTDTNDVIVQRVAPITEIRTDTNLKCKELYLDTYGEGTPYPTYNPISLHCHVELPPAIFEPLRDGGNTTKLIVFGHNKWGGFASSEYNYKIPLKGSENATITEKRQAVEETDITGASIQANPYKAKADNFDNLVYGTDWNYIILIISLGILVYIVYRVLRKVYEMMKE